MKIADLYIRVSTDEQAHKGTSQRTQEEYLRKFCEVNGIAVRKMIFEDHSAKTFNRPAWKTFLAELRRHKGLDLVLFTKWDRFSRNAGDAYHMISILRKLGVEPQAIEQPLDLSVPENKMMLAFYLAAPEVENDRRSLNVFHGMRKARKEGRYMGAAPVGYVNRTDGQGSKSIAPKEPEAGIVRWAYEEIAAGIYNTEQVYQAARKKGLKVARSNFWVTIRNPLYCGKIFVPQYKDEASCLVPGKHDPIVSEALYYDVQDILDGRRKKLRIKPLNNEIFLLRGFLICPHCGKILTGSSSKGRHQYYPYYHCTGTCTCRFRADQVNQLFTQELKKYIPRPEMKDLFQKAFLEAYNNQSKDQLNDKKHITAQIRDLEGKLAKARELLLSGDIDPMDYKTMKSECEEKVNRLQAKMDELVSTTEDSSSMLKKGLDNLFGLGKIYENGDIAVKRRVIGSMYPEKLSFDGKNLRTARVNEALRVIYTLDKGFGEIKNRESDEFSRYSREVVLTGIEPVSKV